MAEETISEEDNVIIRTFAHRIRTEDSLHRINGGYVNEEILHLNDSYIAVKYTSGVSSDVESSKPCIECWYYRRNRATWHALDWPLTKDVRDMIAQDMGG